MRYDAAFCRQAAITGNTKWSQINPSLYSICFTGCAQSIKRCELCLSSAHATKQCILAADPDSDLPTRMKAVESAVVSLVTVRQSGSKPKRPPSTEICRLFNNKHCRFAVSLPACVFQLWGSTSSPGLPTYYDGSWSDISQYDQGIHAQGFSSSILGQLLLFRYTFVEFKLYIIHNMQTSKDQVITLIMTLQLAFDIPLPFQG